ncbi:MAG: DUF1549 domain-containing protein [Planctomycetota bacterium]
MTGLPPTLEETKAFVEGNDSPNAYERVVDRLLASPRFGERMASDWLDVARFADTHGYQMDRFRPMWPYRDWVIRAFNGNLPSTTSFVGKSPGIYCQMRRRISDWRRHSGRIHSQNEEGGIVEEEFRVAYVVDRVNTFGTAFLGLTFECSRCHDHKYDPLTMRDFYSLYSFFQNIAEAGQTTYFTSSMPTPTLLLTSESEDAKIAEFRRELEAKEAKLKQVRDESLSAFESWLSQRPSEVRLPGMIANFDFETVNGVNSKTLPAARAGSRCRGPTLVDGPNGKPPPSPATMDSAFPISDLPTLAAVQLIHSNPATRVQSARHGTASFEGARGCRTSRL